MTTREQIAGRPVLWDANCDEPVAWMNIGDPVVGEHRGRAGQVAFTHELTQAEAEKIYGPVTRVTFAASGGFRSVTYGETTFRSRNLEPADYDESLVEWEDPALEFPCPRCQAPAGMLCQGGSRRHKARDYATLWEQHQRQVAELAAEIHDLRRENERLALVVDHDRRRQPACGRPTRSGTPCKADAILWPYPVESCRLHLTGEERAALDAAQKRCGTGAEIDETG